MRTTFVGYSADCTVRGDLDVGDERLRDFLNDNDGYPLENAVLTRLSDGKEMSLAQMVLDRDELWAAGASEAAGDPDKRLHTVAYPRRARLGPYAVLGAVHERPGVTPLGSLRLSRPFVPFTEARIAYDLNGVMRVDEVETLLVNGRLITWLGDTSGPVDAPGADHPAFALLLQGA
jgi:hypothetical protein